MMLQGDTRWASDPSDGVISRADIGRVLVGSLTSDTANGKTLELVAKTGPAQNDLEPLFAALRPDPADAVLDRDNMPLDGDPAAGVAALIPAGQPAQNARWVATSDVGQFRQLRGDVAHQLLCAALFLRLDMPFC